MEKSKKSFKCNTIVFTKYGKDVEEDPESVVKFISTKCEWVLAQQEKCPETGKIHIQGMAWSKEPARWGWMNGESYWKQKCQSPIDSILYCSKEETRLLGPYEFGLRPTFNVKGQKKAACAARNKMIIDTDIKKLVEEGEVSITQLPAIIKAKNMWNMFNPGDEKDKEPNEWIYGEPGCGKTRFVKETYSDSLYEKSMNKWWDGYQHQDVVLLDDFDKQGKMLGHYLKIWGDRYFGFLSETKGGSIQPNFKKFIITSNYHPDQIFGGDFGDPELCAAICRRFRVGKMDSNSIIHWE